jgi:hypothetical protein
MWKLRKVKVKQATQNQCKCMKKDDLRISYDEY